jgi:hypothetical protein
MSLPSELTLFPPKRMRLQFYTTGQTRTITVSDLLLACGGIVTVVNSVLTSFHSSLKLRRVIIWPGPTSGTPQNATLDWLGASNFTPDRSKIRAMPEGVTVTGGLVFQPPKGSLNGFWQTSANGSSSVFSLAASAGSLIEVDLMVTIPVVDAPVTQTIATGVLGAVYYGYLDGSTTHNYAPVGLTSTF